MSDQEAAEMRAGITRCIAEIDALRVEMQREEKAIEKSRERTEANLAEIAEILADLKEAWESTSGCRRNSRSAGETGGDTMRA